MTDFGKWAANWNGGMLNDSDDSAVWGIEQYGKSKE